MRDSARRADDVDAPQVEPEKTVVHAFTFGTPEPLAHKTPRIKAAHSCAPGSRESPGRIACPGVGLGSGGGEI